MTTARAVAAEALARVEDGAYANLVLGPILDRHDLSPEDRRFTTELVYGTTRMRRAVDWLVDRHLRGVAEPSVRTVLRLGAYQLAYIGTPPHAAVSATVDEAPARARGLVNAVLRKVANDVVAGVRWPDAATRLSYPDWIVERLAIDLGAHQAEAALERMNVAPSVHVRSDGYVQDPASEAVAGVVGVQPGHVVLDVCSAPGGKATAMAAAGAGMVAAADVNPVRAALVRANATRTGHPNVAAVVADGRRPPFRPGSADRVLVDAPCSGLGVLRRRPDARWRIEPGDVRRLADLQRKLLDAATLSLAPGGVLVYSVCTLTAAETVGIDEWLTDRHPDLAAVDPPGDPWVPAGRGARLLPQAADTDGMFVVALRRP